ncbi:hypothetical protein J0H58_15070 [bacterium]|nr:hypothetical protein [bacterium]
MPAPFVTDDTPPACGPTLAAVQRVLDGAEPVAVLDADPHAAGCAGCRARVDETRVLLAALALPPEPVAVPARFADGVLTALKADRRERRRRRLLMSVGGGFAVAAAVAVAVVLLNRTPDAPGFVEQPPAVVPTPQAPAPRPVRVSAELARAGDALRESSRPLAEPVAAAPKVVAGIAEAIIPPMAAPVNDDVLPVAASLAELPAAARTGLEPVTGTTQKAFDRFLRDVGVFQTSARPKS